MPSIRPGPSFTFKSKVVGIDLGGATAAQPGPGETRPGQQPVVPRLRTDPCCPLVSVVSVVSVVPVTQDPLCCRMKSLLLLATFTLSVTVAAPQNGFFSGITNAFNDFFGGSSKSVDDTY